MQVQLGVCGGGQGEGWQRGQVQCVFVGGVGGGYKRQSVGSAQKSRQLLYLGVWGKGRVGGRGGVPTTYQPAWLGTASLAAAFPPNAAGCTNSQ
jgi:hypothetical protein